MWGRGGINYEGWHPDSSMNNYLGGISLFHPPFYMYTYIYVYLPMLYLQASLVAQTVKCLPAIRETRVRSLVREDPLEKEMAIHPSTLAWKIPWTEEPGGLQSMESQRVGHDWATSLIFYLSSIYDLSISICVIYVFCKRFCLERHIWLWKIITPSFWRPLCWEFCKTFKRKCHGSSWVCMSGTQEEDLS